MYMHALIRLSGAACGAGPRDACQRWRGSSMVELSVTLVVMGVLLSLGVPRFQGSLEQSRADVAGANLRAIWSGQRLYWLQNRTYAPNLATLQAAGLIDSSLVNAGTTYTYEVTAASDTDFTATATRVGSLVWSGTLTIAADGTISGSIQQAGSTTSIVPGFQ
jgi:Tfp pilus assembly protein PilE